MGLYANLVDFQPRALDIRVQISAAPFKSSVYGSGFKTRGRTSGRKSENAGSGFVFKDFISSVEEASRTALMGQLSCLGVALLMDSSDIEAGISALINMAVDQILVIGNGKERNSCILACVVTSWYNSCGNRV